VGRASAAALIAFATKKLSQEAILAKAQELGINLEQPHLKQFLRAISKALVSVLRFLNL